MNDAKFWADLTRQHLALDKDLENLWRLGNGGSLLLTDVAARLSWVLVMAVFAVGAQRGDAIVLSVAVASGAVAQLLMHLYPVAQVTSICQSQVANMKSIPRLTYEYVNHSDFTSEAQAAQARFLQYVLGTSVGIEIPVLGLIT